MPRRRAQKCPRGRLKCHRCLVAVGGCQLDNYNRAPGSSEPAGFTLDRAQGAEAVLLRGRYAVMKEAARARRR